VVAFGFFVVFAAGFFFAGAAAFRFVVVDIRPS
jgi:hypothetical protein